MPKWLDRLFGRTDGSRASDAYVTRVYIDRLMDKTPEELYNEQPALRAVVSFLAREIASVPFKFYTMSGENERDRVRNRDSVPALLLSHPNEDQTTYELIEQTIVDLKLHGWALWLVGLDSASPSGWTLRPIPPAWVTQVKTSNGFAPSSYIVNNRTVHNASNVEIPASMTIRFGEYCAGNPAAAASPINALKLILAEQLSSLEFRNQVWQNGGRVTGYLTRPAAAWTPEARDRFLKEWKEYTKNGAKAGGMPLLEDGMEIKTVQFNAKEAEWAQATTLSRQDVAGVYHVNPSMVWSNDGQTYASVKENARSLYVDTLGPDLVMIQDRISKFLIPRIGGPEGLYGEFDIQSKLSGNFEDQISLFQTATGGPIMTRGEARQKLNLPYIEGTDELILPLNVILGGQASPTDTDTSKLLAASVLTGKDAQPSTKDDEQLLMPLSMLNEFIDHTPHSEQIKQAFAETEIKTEAPRKSRGQADAESVDEIEKALTRFFERQEKSVLSAMGSDPKLPSEGVADWWDADRWNKELAEDLEPIFQKAVNRSGVRAMKELGLDASDFDKKRTEEFVCKMAQRRASAANSVTYKQLSAAVEGKVPDHDLSSTPKGVFERARDARATSCAQSFATQASGFGATEAGRQIGDGNVFKTWNVTSGNPRSSHALMDGETVPIDEAFSNGAQWPGDSTLSPDEACGCCCEVTITIP